MATLDLTTGELARILRVHRNFLRREFDAGRLDGYRVGPNRRIPLLAALDYVRTRKLPGLSELEQRAARIGVAPSLSAPLLLVTADPAAACAFAEWDVTHAGDWFSCAMGSLVRTFAAAVFDSHLGTVECVRAIARYRQYRPEMVLGLVAPEDSLVPASADCVWEHRDWPACARELWQAVKANAQAR